MKRIAIGLVFATIGLTGCLPMDFLHDKPKPPPPRQIEQPPPVVTEDQVNEKNAADSARALRTEIEFDMLRRPASPSE